MTISVSTNRILRMARIILYLLSYLIDNDSNVKSDYTMKPAARYRIWELRFQGKLNVSLSWNLWIQNDYILQVWWCVRDENILFSLLGGHSTHTWNNNLRVAQVILLVTSLRVQRLKTRNLVKAKYISLFWRFALICQLASKSPQFCPVGLYLKIPAD